MDKHLNADLLGDYAEGILDPAARAAADAHLQGCADCRREAEVAAAYFKEMAGLEPIQAPADFLAKVRARLPGESPWRRALASLARPWRALPLQLALATLIGITAVTVYVQQGGMERESMTVVMETRPQATAPAPAPVTTMASPAEPRPPGPGSESGEKKAKLASAPRDRGSADKDFAAEYGRAAEVDKLSESSGAGPGVSSSLLSNSQPLSDAGGDAALGAAVEALEASQTLAKKSASAPRKGAAPIASAQAKADDESRDVPAAVAPAAPAEATAKMSDESRETSIPANRPAPASAVARRNEESREPSVAAARPAPASPPAPVAAGRARQDRGLGGLAQAEPEAKQEKSPAAPRMEEPAAAPKAKAGKPAAAPVAESRYGQDAEEVGAVDGFSDRSRSATKERSAESVGEKGGNAKPRARPESMPAQESDNRKSQDAEPSLADRQAAARGTLTLNLRALKDTTALFAGLKSMGIRSEPVPMQGGFPWIRRRLETPESMAKEAREYLSRYGYLTGTMGAPLGDGVVRSDLVIVKPPRP